MRPALALTTLLALACTRPHVPAPPPAPPPVPEPAPAVTTGPALRLHELEQRRDSAPLLARSDRGPELLLALARIGDRPALDALLTSLRGDDPRQREHAARALGIAVLLDSDPTGIEPALLAAWPRADPDERIAIAEALGRLGTTAALPRLRDALAIHHPQPLRATAGLALGVLGRRKHPLDAATRVALLTALADPNLAVPALYALANEPAPPPDPTTLATLRSHTRVADPERQQLALAAVLRRLAPPPLQTCLARALAEATRDPKRLDALLSPDRNLAVATTLAWIQQIVDDRLLDDRRALAHTRQLHAALDCLADDASPVTPAERTTLDALLPRLSTAAQALTAALATGAVPELAPWRRARRHLLAQLHCQVLQRRAHDSAWRLPLACHDDLIGTRERLIRQLAPLVHGFGGDWPTRQQNLDAALTNPDPAVRIAAVTALAPLWNDPTTAVTVETWLLRALDDRSVGVLGTAVDLITAHHGRPDPKPPALRSSDPLALRLTALTELAARRDPELCSTLLASLAATRLPTALPTCEALRADPSPAIRKAARSCVQQLVGADPGPTAPLAGLPRPPHDPNTLPDQQLRWQLATDHGPIDVLLDPGAAPWAVASIVALTTAGFYDELVFHRDVRNFVLQGGDPDGTGWGGPGYVLPSEPTNHRFTRGAVGIADAGKDTGGSQFFFMHAHAPHLEGRYTWVGHVVPEHLDRLDQLSLGDRILSARITVTPP